jgi:hypothetical protein
MRPLIAAIDAGLVGIAIQAKTGSKAGGFVAAVAIYALIIYRHRTEQTPSESRDVEPGRPTLVRDNGEHQGSPTAALWHGFKWLAAVVILFVMKIRPRQKLRRRACLTRKVQNCTFLTTPGLIAHVCQRLPSSSIMRPTLNATFSWAFDHCRTAAGLLLRRRRRK